MRSKYSLSMETVSRAPRASDIVVKLRTSENRMDAF
jgi:hypothetical protein